MNEASCTLLMSAPGAAPVRIPCGAGANLLDATLDAGWLVPHSCRRGVCGSCRATLVEGVVDGPRGDDGQVLLCQARAAGQAHLRCERLEPAAPPQRLASHARLYRVQRLAPDVAHVVLRLPNGVQPRWEAGQSLQLRLPDGTERSYSMARPPLPDHSLHLHVRLVPGGQASQWLETALREDEAGARARSQMLQVRLPFGAMSLPARSQRPAVLLASGTGFSALGAVLEAAVQQRDTRPLHLYWGARRRADLYDLARAEELVRQLPAARLVPVLSEAAAEDEWFGRRGLVHRSVMEDFADLREVDVLACGAPAMLAAAERDFRAERGLSAARWRADAFHPAGASAVAGTVLPPGAAG